MVFVSVSGVVVTGMRAYGVSKGRLVSQLEEWVELHLNDKVPLSLLLLSRTLYLPRSGDSPNTPAEQLKATISTLPSQVSLLIDQSTDGHMCFYIPVKT